MFAAMVKRFKDIAKWKFEMNSNNCRMRFSNSVCTCAVQFASSRYDFTVAAHLMNVMWMELN